MEQLHRRFGILWCLVGVAGLGFASLRAQDQKPADKDKAAPAEKKEAKDAAAPKNDGKSKQAVPDGSDEWTKMAAPSEHHKKLDSLVGTWNLTIKYAGEGMPESKGKSEFKWVMDGRFLVETSKTDVAGQPFEWMGWHAYDNRKKHYLSVWADNFDTGIEMMTGKFDDAKKTLTYVGEGESPERGGKIKVKWVIRLESNDRFTTEMYEGTGNGHENKVMEIVATRG